MAVDQGGNAKHPPSDPAPPPSRGTTHAPKLSLFLAVSMGIGAWLFATALMPHPTPTAGVQATTMPDLCADAVERVQAYQAPGQREPLVDAIAASVAAEGLRRPVALVGWDPPHVWRGDCEVGLRVSIGNEITTLRWAVRTDTGRVEAMNDLTKQMSGW
jgi:hypothetical protein